MLLENVRFHKEETKTTQNSPSSWPLAELYVNDAFGTAPGPLLHRRGGGLPALRLRLPDPEGAGGHGQRRWMTP